MNLYRDLSDADLVDCLRHLADYQQPGEDYLAELERRLRGAEEEPFVLPVAVSEAIRSHFGGGKRTFDALIRRIRFAYRVWQGKYGPWTPDQADYAEELVVWAIGRAAGKDSPGHARAAVYLALDRIVNHENTHAGFAGRAGASVDVTNDLLEALA